MSKTEATGNSPVEIPQLLRSNLATWNIDCTYTGSGVWSQRNSANLLRRCGSMRSSLQNIGK